MKRQFSSLAVLVAFLSALPAAARTFQTDPDPEILTISPADMLRSAFYQRDSGRDRATSAATRKELRDDLRCHFEVVLATLIDNGDRSLDVALNRLEQSRGERWTEDQRQAWRQTLAQRRALNIRRLRLYQLRGLFPQNEHTAGSAVPIFVDNHDTACAVGHLMRESGWDGAVAAIQRANNFVFVTDVRDGPLVDWVLVSGLTQEEAALIQPSYFPPLFDETFDVLSQGGSITKNGLHYDNFHFIAGELQQPDAFPDVPPPVNQVNLASYGAASRQGVFQPVLGARIDPMFDDWLFVGAISEFNSIRPTDDPWGVLFSYDVAPVNPQRHLVAASLESSGANYNFLGLGGGVLEIAASIYASGSTAAPLAELSIDGIPLGFFIGADSVAFQPQQKITVVTAVQVEGAGAAFTSIVQSFQLAPEPASAGLAGWACAVAFGFRRRSLSSKTAPW